MMTARPVVEQMSHENYQARQGRGEGHLERTDPLLSFVEISLNKSHLEEISTLQQICNSMQDYVWILQS